MGCRRDLTTGRVAVPSPGAHGAAPRPSSPATPGSTSTNRSSSWARSASSIGSREENATTRPVPSDATPAAGVPPRLPRERAAADAIRDARDGVQPIDVHHQVEVRRGAAAIGAVEVRRVRAEEHVAAVGAHRGMAADAVGRAARRAPAEQRQPGRPIVVEVDVLLPPGASVVVEVGRGGHERDAAPVAADRGVVALAVRAVPIAAGADASRDAVREVAHEDGPAVHLARGADRAARRAAPWTRRRRRARCR